MAPDEGGEKPYALLFEAIAKRLNTTAVAKDRDAQPRAHCDPAPGQQGHAAAHHVLSPTRSAKPDEFRTDTSPVKRKELNLAKMLIDIAGRRISSRRSITTPTATT